AFSTDLEVTPTRRAAQRRPAIVEAEAVTAASRETSVDATDPERNPRAGTDNMPTGAIEGRGRPAEDDTFAPTGVRVGTFVLRPRLDQGIGFTSNASSSADGGSSTYSE